ncbi:MAG TPA: hypothetical protein VGM84_21680 [Steroidobacteraceae bacterium]|jgi:hypothetical protein
MQGASHLTSSLTLAVLASLLACGAETSGSDAQQFARLSEALDRSGTASLLEFGTPCWYCRQSALDIPHVLELASSRPLTSSEAAYIRRVLRTRSSFIVGLAKSCGPFVPEFGLRFQFQDRQSIFLISRSCQTARLLPEPGSRPYFFNIDPILPTLLRTLHFKRQVFQ